MFNGFLSGLRGGGPMVSLTRWNPFRELDTLHRDVDELFRRSLGEWAGFGRGFGHLWREMEDFPLIESYVKDDHFIVKAYIPGIDPKEIDVSVTGNSLTLKGERKQDKDIKEENYMLHEICYGSFERTIGLPEGVNVEKLHASFDEGMLTISAPVKEGVKTKKISVDVSKKRAKAA